MKLGVWIQELEPLPAGYGVAWYSPYSFRAFCLPVPLNRIAGAFRAWYLEWRRPVEDDPIMQAFNYGHARGLNTGRSQGQEAAIRLMVGIVKDIQEERGR